MSAAPAPPSRGRVIFLDPSLGAAHGHHAVVARNYRALLAGRSVVFAGHRGGGSDAPVFRHRLEDAFRICRYAAPWMGHTALVRAASMLKRLRPARRGAALPAAQGGAPLDAAQFAHLFSALRVDAALQELWRAVEFGPEDDVVALGVDPALLCALQSFDQPGAPRLHLLFMYPEADFLGAATADAYWAIARARAQSARSVHAELAAHAEMLSGALQRPVGLQPTPVRIAPLPPPPAEGFVIAALGAGRADKGFLALPEIAQAMLARAPDIRLRIQAPEQGQGLEAAAQALRAMPNVTLLSARLSDAAYEAELAGAHLILLAYDQTRYVTRGSGVLNDALIGGRPVLCSSGTALADTIAAGAGLTAENAEGFAAAALDARARYQSLIAAAQAEAARMSAAVREGALMRALS